MKINKLTNNYVLQHIKDLFIDNKDCCGEFSFKLICCNVNKVKWTFFRDEVSLTHQLKNKHIAALNYLRKDYSDNYLVNKVLLFNCCNRTGYFTMQNVQTD